MDCYKVCYVCDDWVSVKFGIFESGRVERGSRSSDGSCLSDCLYGGLRSLGSVI